MFMGKIKSQPHQKVGANDGYYLNNINQNTVC